MRLMFDHGTLVLCEPPDLELRDLPGVVWDARVGLYRAPACCYALLVRELTARGIAFDDRVRAREARETGPWREPELRSYQHAALLAWELAGRRGTLALPTGSGKTRVALAAMAGSRSRALCLVPTRVLLRQWLQELAHLYGGMPGCLGDGERSVGEITVATFESAYRYMPEIGQLFDLIVIDEVHHFGSSVYDVALEMCTAAQRLGLSATPPSDAHGSRLEALVGPVVYQLGVGDLRGRWLADFDRVVIRLSLDDEERERYLADYAVFKRVHSAISQEVRGASWQEFSALARCTPEGRAALAAWRRAKNMLGLTRAKRSALRRLLSRHKQSRVLVFTADNESAYEVAREHLIMPITCDISRSERESALAAFRSGELRALVSARVLNEGIDVPDADVAILVAGSQGEREYVQRVGRLLRPRAGKRALVYELVTSGTSEAARAWQRRSIGAARSFAVG